MAADAGAREETVMRASVLFEQEKPVSVEELEPRASGIVGTEVS